jgi:hypothetical protein
VKQRRESFPQNKDSTKKHSFFCVVATAADDRELLPDNKDLVAAHLQSQYSKYANLTDQLKQSEQEGNADDAAIAVQRNSTDINAVARSTALTVDTTATAPAPSTSQVPRPVTPGALIDDQSNSSVGVSDSSVDSILKSLFHGIIDSDILERDDLFVDKSIDAAKALRTRIQELGCQYQKSDIRQHYRRFYDSTDADDTRCASLEASSCMLVLTQRFNMPVVLPALRDIIQAILKIAETVPEVLELPKQGGNKGTGQQLIVITPSVTEERLCRNAKQWMPKLLDTAVDPCSELSNYHAISSLIKVLSKLDSQAFVDVCRSSTHGEIQRSKIDKMLQKALMCDAHLSQSQFNFI